MPPNWLIAILLLAIAIFKINSVLKYRKNHVLFIKDIGGDWIDKSQLKSAIKAHIAIQVSFFAFLPLFPILVYYRALVPYLWPIAITFIGIQMAAFVWWNLKFSKKQS